jgi:homogentisate 1,2-dioxygenase
MMKAIFLIKIKKKNDAWSGLCYASFDVVGWDGYNYPYGFSIHILNPQDGTSTATSTSNIEIIL